jgi:ribA/ribD-fused uncharacterized protein
MKIDGFHGPFRFLSNFHVADDGYCVEHRYQAEKTLDPDQRAWIMAASTGKEARRRGQQATLRPGWEAMKNAVMWTCLLRKFSDPGMLEALLLTQDAELVEANWWGDRHFGVCRGVGHNWLGRMLMALRDAARAGRTPENPDRGTNAQIS